MLIHNFLENSVTRYPGKITVVHDEQRIIYAELGAQSERLAYYLTATGITFDGRNLYSSTHLASLWFAYFGIGRPPVKT